MELKPLKAGDIMRVWVNQAERVGEVLAVLDDMALVEYSMPKGTSALRFYHANRRTFLAKISYLSLPTDWVAAILYQGALQDLIGKPQQIGKGQKLTINICPDFRFVKVDDHGRD